MQSTDVLAAFTAYTSAFQALDPRSVSSHFHEPAVMITPRDVLALPSASSVEEAYARIMHDLPPDYARTHFGPLVVRRLSDDLAQVVGAGTWKDGKDRDLMPFGLTYTLRLVGSRWLIVVAAIHAADAGVE
jgi:hypothetical protein